MSKKILAVAAASSAAVIATVAPATAGTTTSGAYQQHTGSLTCNTVTNTLHVTVSGRETRPIGNHFRTDTIATRIRAQVQNNDGSWSTVKVSGPTAGHLGPVHTNAAGDKNFRRFVWNGSTRLSLSIGVNPKDNLFRASVISRLRDNENVLISTLVNNQGSCRLPSNAARTAR